NHKKIKKFVSTTDCGPGKRQTLKKAEHPEVEEALYMWFLQERNRHAPISGPIYGIRLLSISGEKLSAQPQLVQPFKEKLMKTITELDLRMEQIYNADESGLYWKISASGLMAFGNSRTSQETV
ncbi:unnamed protein product, partial [Acanthoscelides obtectus]